MSDFPSISDIIKKPIGGVPTGAAGVKSARPPKKVSSSGAPSAEEAFSSKMEQIGLQGPDKRRRLVCRI